MKKINIKNPFGKVSAAIITGSGLSGLMPGILPVTEIPYSAISSFPETGVKGHPGELVFGTLDGIPVALFRGRFHVYEGHSALTAALPVAAAAEMGADFVYLTNASGGISSFASPGTLMLITDHLNLMGTNPVLDIPVPERKKYFPDMSRAYNPEMMASLKHAAAKTEIKLAEGVLASLSGPCYETPAEVRMLRALGADAVSMSVAPEVIMASYLGVKTAAVTVITNRAADLNGTPITHDDAIDAARGRTADLSTLITMSIKELCL